MSLTNLSNFSVLMATQQTILTTGTACLSAHQKSALTTLTRHHINSVEKDDLGNYLVSARFTSSITYIHAKTGKIIWVLGGKRNTFSDLSNGQATNMAYQHLARFHPLTAFPDLLAKEIAEHGVEKHKDGTTRQLLSAFDNGAEQRPARGILIELTYPSQSVSSRTPYTARLVQAYEHPLHVPSVSQGSMQLVHSNVTGEKDPHVLVGFGHIAMWTEFSADGTLLCDSRITTEQTFGQGHVQSYSALKYKWIAQPSYPPSAVAASSKSSLFVSWNGATEVKAWKLYQLETKANDASPDHWIPISTTTKTGFETEITFPPDFNNKQTRYLKVEALDAHDKVLGTSLSVDLWAQSFTSRIRQMTPLSGVVVSVIVLVLLIALVVSCIDWKRSSGYRKLRKH
jgi:hypothetical protein